MTETMLLRSLPWLTAAASLAFAVAAEGTLASSGWVYSALGWTAFATHDAQLCRVLRKWEETTQKLTERR
jgi:hypothetical protein